MSSHGEDNDGSDALELLSSIRHIYAENRATDDGERCCVAPSPELQEKINKALKKMRQAAPDEPFPTLVLVAVTAASDVVGLAVALRRYPGDRSVVGHRMTATERGWRNRGVALALKQELLRRGRTEGVVTFQASNDDGNAPMRAINERLGYQLDYRLVLMRRDL